MCRKKDKKGNIEELIQPERGNNEVKFKLMQLQITPLTTHQNRHRSALISSDNII